MKVLLVNKFHYLKGGSEKYYFELGELLKEHGHKVAYFSMEDDKNIKTKDKEYFVKSIDLYTGSKFKALDVIYSKENAKLNNITNIEIINGDAAVQFDKLIKNNTKFDVALVDPPRKGCTPESINNLVKLSKNYIAHVSCNVSTLARDMNLLAEYGYFPIYIQPADMFPNTYHIETIAFFEKQKKEAI